MKRFRPFLGYLKPVKGTLIAALFCGLIFGAANGAGLPLMMKWVFPQIFAEDAVALTTMELLLVAAWLPLIFVIRGLSGYANVYLVQLAGVKVLERIRLDFFSKLQRLPLSFLQRQSSGDLISRGLADTNQLQFTLTFAANEIIRQPATLLGSIGFLVWVAFNERGVALVLVCLAVVPLCVLPIRFIGKKIVRRAQEVQTELGSITGRFSENLAAAREVRAFGLEEREVGKFSGISSALVRFQMKVVKYQQALNPAIEIISAVGISITLIYAYRVGVELESFLSLITALYLSYEPIKKLGGLNNELKKGSAALARIETVLNEPVTINDPADPQPFDQVRGDISMENVAFAYRGSELVLQDINVHIPAGTVCALVGPSGAGKSTFANLVPRFYEAAAGAVKIDGTDVRDVTLADLRRHIGIVSQESVLFDDTVYNNLLVSRPNATRQDVEAAARAAYAHDFIMSLPHGYDTVVGERGASLSGGQRQRLALARAFLRDAPILILDEATSALDSESEAFIQWALRELVVGKTVLIIAHRFSTIRDASMILVFDRGRVAARGTHAELLESSPLYKTLYNRQATLSSE
ncbi:ABC transporter ATP-binding protein [Actomonas aquatica]|uniref:ABC transporter ATP-binding protein n=1 Tax=Actomonas aquatica TaxID=2866162 RepID=A0ABZ1CBQ7_9BACT|nr:ABC transporter ATP-binding protein [Opitutus sp. WL0086]WRQ88747.1 ABC transporter ATP-binding protein [Opitutus sp. WL0086]